MRLPEDLSERLRGDPDLRASAAHADVTFALACRGGDAWRFRFTDGRVDVGVDTGDEPRGQRDVSGGTGDAAPADFRVELDAADWEAVLSPRPAPRRQHVLAFLAPRGSGTVAGNAECFAQHLHLVRRVVEVIRGDATPASGTPPPSPERIVGRYLRVETEAWGTCDAFHETAGDGPPVVLLATAGGDGRQYHGLLTDDELTGRYQLTAVDVPWHGRSNPPYGRTGTSYRLDSDSYTGFIARFIEGLALREKPILVGVSMAGAVVVEMAARHPGLIAGAVGCQVGPRVGNRHSPWLRNARVNQTLHVPEWTYGLMSPASPRADRDRVWWNYSQGGFGTYERDIVYYSTCWDVDRVRHLFGKHTPPVVLLSGAYDYSVPPEQTRRLAAAIPGARFLEMPELGHFPHAENPPAFARYLRWALDEIRQERT